MTDEELKRLFEALRDENVEAHAETRRYFEVAVEHFSARFESLAATLRQENATAHSETRRHFEVAIEHFDTRINGLAESIAGVDERLERRASAIEDRMERGFSDTQAMIKFSHAELDKRVRALEEHHQELQENQRTLEETLAELQARVERLESSTH